MHTINDLKEKIENDIKTFQAIIKTVEKGHGENCLESMEYQSKIAYAKELLKVMA